jgi:hypothetical protein
MKKRKHLPRQIKRDLYLRANNSCENCKLSEWLGQRAVLEVHHLDGDSYNNEIDNLLLLCLNCHSQTPSWRGKGKKLIGPRAKPKKRVNLCPKCNKVKTYRAKTCSQCVTHTRIKKFELTKEELEYLLDTLPMTKIAEMFSVSDVSIRKRAKTLGIELEDRRGYWTKTK